MTSRCSQYRQYKILPTHTSARKTILRMTIYHWNATKLYFHLPHFNWKRNLKRIITLHFPENHNALRKPPKIKVLFRFDHRGILSQKSIIDGATKTVFSQSLLNQNYTYQIVHELQDIFVNTGCMKPSNELNTGSILLETFTRQSPRMQRVLRTEASTDIETFAVISCKWTFKIRCNGHSRSFTENSLKKSVLIVNQRPLFQGSKSNTCITHYSSTCDKSVSRPFDRTVQNAHICSYK